MTRAYCSLHATASRVHLIGCLERSAGRTFLLLILTAAASCGALPLLLGSEVSGDHSIRTRVAGGTRRAGHTVALHQRECTCGGVGPSPHIIVSCYVNATRRISIRKTAPFLNISNRNPRPRIRRTMSFGVITNMRSLHAFRFSRNNENQILVLRGLAMQCRRRCINLPFAARLVQYPSPWRHLTTQQYSTAQIVGTS